jgi:hypothetical protein
MQALVRDRHRQLTAGAAQHRMVAEATRHRREVRATSPKVVGRLRQALGRRMVAFGMRIQNLPPVSAVIENPVSS